MSWIFNLFSKSSGRNYTNHRISIRCNFTKYFAAKFDELGIKKLISTSYAPESKKMVLGGLFSAFEQESPQFVADKSKTHGKIFVLEKDVTGDGRINIDDLEWGYLEGDGDFRSEEVTKLRDAHLEALPVIGRSVSHRFRYEQFRTSNFVIPEIIIIFVKNNFTEK